MLKLSARRSIQIIVIIHVIYTNTCITQLGQEAANVAEWLRELIFITALNQSIISTNAVSGVGSSPTRVQCETSQALLAGVPGVFVFGVLPFSPHLLISTSHMS